MTNLNIKQPLKAKTTSKPRQRRTYIASDLPKEGFIRLPSFAKAIGVSPNTIMNRIRDGRFPPGILLTTKTRVWPVEEIRELIEKIKRGEA